MSDVERSLYEFYKINESELQLGSLLPQFPFDCTID